MNIRIELRERDKEEPAAKWALQERDKEETSKKNGGALAGLESEQVSYAACRHKKEAKRDERAPP